MIEAMGFDFLRPIPAAFFWIALAAWTAAFGGLLHALLRRFRPAAADAR
jgi:hypothetical protein